MSIEQALDYQFKDKKLLDRALTHPGYHRHKGDLHFERLEFLGDRVLGLVMADMTYKQFPNESEGFLANQQSHLVSRQLCHEIAVKYHIDRYLKINEKDCQSINTSVLANTLESLLGAMYLDGGIAPCAHFIQKAWGALIATNIEKDSKSYLQEWAQKKGYGIPAYALIDRRGPDHAPIFIYEVAVSDKLKTRGEGTTRKLAQQEAAREFLQNISQKK